VPRIAVNNGYCFAGNAALFGCADFCIATRSSWIGMAGPAMIEGGGMGKHEPTAIGPIEVQEKNGVVDIVADDEAHATRIARQLLSYFQGSVATWESAPQESLRDAIPEDRRWGYPVRRIIETLADTRLLPRTAAHLRARHHHRLPAAGGQTDCADRQRLPAARRCR
jgi:acetyl-CoA carboxylase carboxyltransferase component